jgi:hypothetical protein
VLPDENRLWVGFLLRNDRLFRFRWYCTTCANTRVKNKYYKMANTYAVDILPLAVLASGAADNPAAGIAQGDALSDQHVADASKQHRNRKKLAMTEEPLVTAAELVASKRRKHEVQSANFDGPVPLWAQQMQQQMQQMQQQLGQQMQHLGQQTDRRIQQESERSTNRSRRNTSDPIVNVIRLLDGAKPNVAPHVLWFPRDYDQLSCATGPRVNALLDFYGVGGGGDAEANRKILTNHLGVTL